MFTLLTVVNMKRNDSQQSLVDIWPKVQKRKTEADSSSLGGESVDISEDESLAESNNDYTEDQTKSELFQSGATARKCMCCNDDQRAYHPNEGTIISLFAKKGRRFLPIWYDKFPWITMCSAQKKVFCVYCRYAHKHKLLTFCKKGDKAFSVRDFDNYKKAIEKFRIHENSDSHLEARLKCKSLNNPSIQEQLSTQGTKVQETWRLGLMKQLKSWIEEGKYMSHDIVNELITLMGQSVLRKLLCQIKSTDPCWFAIIVDETADIACHEQLNLAIRYVDNDYIISELVSELTIGLFSLPDTTAKTLHVVVKDLLL